MAIPGLRRRAMQAFKARMAFAPAYSWPISLGEMSAKPPSGAPRLLLGALLLLCVLAAGHAVLWHALVTRLEGGFAAWVAAQKATGRLIGHGAPQRGGWPLAATLHVPAFEWTEGEAALSLAAVTLRLEPLRLDRLRLDLPGQHSLRMGGTALPFAARRLAAEMPLEAAPLPSEVLLSGEALAFGPVTLRRLALRFTSQVAAGAEAPAATLRASLEELTLPPEAGAAVATLGRTLALIELDLALSGPLPPGRASSANVATWRDAGGTLTLHEFGLRWGDVVGNLRGRFGLDAALQPRGAATLRLSGADAVLQAATATGLLEPNNAGAARLVLRLMSRVPPGGGPPELELPMALEDRRLVVARMPLGQIPAWRWARP